MTTATTASSLSTAASAAVRFRPEIQGLRALAALLVAIYHIWLGRVSGGVDVFFVVSGYLVIGSLLRQVERSGRVDFVRFWGNLAKRLLPVALLVIVCVLLASLLWLPRVRWAETASELLAAALYYENWQLAFNAVDYLAQDNAASPVQHYWALSIQGQFYLVWPFVVALVAWAHRRSGVGLRGLMTGTVVAVFCASLAYSIHVTAVDQPFAYFDTGARACEFALGGLLALWLPRLHLTTPWSAVLGWLGVIAMLACGLVLQVSTVFPGYAALWPTLAAGLILAAGIAGGRFGAHRLLASPALMRMGDVSYALYLWHWPILVFWLLYSGREHAGAIDGTLVLAASIVLAFVSTRWAETPIRRSDIGTQHPNRALALGAVLLAPPLLAILAWAAYVERGTPPAIIDPAYPGAMAMHADAAPPPAGIEVLPGPLHAKADLPSSYASGCHQKPRESAPISCAFGPEQARFTVALVGGSHSAHWLPALQRLVEERDIRVINFTKSACRFIAIRRGDPSCPLWNAQVLEALATLKPDLVITTATLGVGREEHIPPGYVQQWERLDRLGIPVLAIRDNPRPGFDAPECVEQHGPDSPACELLRANALLPVSPTAQVHGIPGNVRFADYTDYFCDETRCPMVIGNVLVYRDAHHLTATYVRTMAPLLWRDIEKTLDRRHRR